MSSSGFSDKRSVASAAILWLLLWVLGFPASHHDDAFFSGTAIHVARHGELANPWLADWIGHIPGANIAPFFLHPPFQPRAFGAWLYFLGINTASVTGFACFCGFLGTTALGLLLHRSRVPRFASLLAMLAFAAFIATRGLRPEGMGCALLLLGMALVPGRSSLLSGLGIGLLLSAPLCHSFLGIFALPALLVGLWVKYQRDNQALHRLLFPGMIAGLIVSALFLWAIRGEWQAFWHAFFGHAEFVRPGSETRWPAFRDELLLGQEKWLHLAVIGLTAALAIWKFRQEPKSTARALPIAAILAGVLLAGYFLYAQFLVAFLILGCALGSICLATNQSPRAVRVLSCLPALFLVAWIGLQQTIQQLANSKAPAPKVELQNWLAAQGEIALGLDAYTLRHVFDYNPPGEIHLLDWNGAPGSSPRWYDPAALADRDAWVANPLILPELLHLDMPRPMLTIFGRSLRSVRPKTAVLLVLGPGLSPPPATSGIPHLRSTDPALLSP